MEKIGHRWGWFALNWKVVGWEGDEAVLFSHYPPANSFFFILTHVSDSYLIFQFYHLLCERRKWFFDKTRADLHFSNERIYPLIRLAVKKLWHGSSEFSNVTRCFSNVFFCVRSGFSWVLWFYFFFFERNLSLRRMSAEISCQYRGLLLIFFWWKNFRYIEIFRSSLAEVRAVTGPKMRPPAAGFGRMAPYNRSERLGGPNRFKGVDGSARFPRMPRYES